MEKFLSVRIVTWSKACDTANSIILVTVLLSSLCSMHKQSVLGHFLMCVGPGCVATAC